MFGVGPLEIAIVLAVAFLMAIFPTGRRWLPWIVPALVVATLASPGGDPASMIIVAVPVLGAVVLPAGHHEGWVVEDLVGPEAQV